MWVLHCDGDAFGYKRLWLKPGTTHVIGRTKARAPDEANGLFHGINDKSVSRKHIILSVDPIPAGNALALDKKSRLTIEDGSKLGTWLDDTRVQSSGPVILSKPEHTIKLGTWGDRLKIIWIPVGLALTYISKSKKSYDAEFQRVASMVEPFDIKVTSEYDSKYTTHVVVSKRNIAATLEGLVNGAYIVTSAFIDAIREVAEADDDTTKAKLEDDYEGYWPDPIKYVPAEGKEPNPRSSELYAPNPDRKSVFDGYTFIFCLENQLDNLQAPITAGGGKALLYSKFQLGHTSPEDFVSYVKQKAGDKGVGELEDGNSGGGVVVVRISTTAGDEDWLVNFIQSTDLQLGQRSVLQNEFLDPIIMNDASGLRQPLKDEDAPSTAESSARPPRNDQTSARQLEAVPESPPKVASSAPVTGTKSSALSRRLRLGRAKSRFPGFDEFDTSGPSVPAVEEEHNEDIQMRDGGDTEQNSDAMAGLEAITEARRPNKRAAASASLDENAPAAAAVKRRRIEAGLEDTSQSQSQSSPKMKQEAPAAPVKLFRRLKVNKETAPEDDERNIMNDARARRVEEEEKARREEEDLKKPLDADEMASIKSHIQYGEIKVLPSRKASAALQLDGRWNDEWNGRKNFKKFRRKGETGPAPLRGTRVIVPLQQSAKRDNTLGSVRFATAPSKSASRNTQISANSSHGRPSFAAEDDEEENDSQVVLGRRSTNNGDTGTTIPDFSSSDEEGPTVSKDLGAMPGRVRRAQEKAGLSESPEPEMPPAKKRPNKRAAEAPPAATKRQTKRSRIADSDDASEGSGGSEDELRFKFSSRRKRR
ncbi:hypothetical protein BT63DRAFT_443473 [Microthyrium microscopicum]|uniref:FHA domain-containing protein n=1 Tax=Microthyrium microscopicum TaxID=703497 RepID=A0A6A6U197_9PEZI|nr:hypothetical protein BT63DRAFT_443473 [Microthyrium microscopicum]